MRFLLKIILLFICYSNFGQSQIADTLNIPIDSLYREDQFYAGMHFNMMFQKPQDYSVTKLSTGFTTGFLRDMPINKSRTVAFAVGLGASYNKFVHNLVVKQEDNKIVYEVLSTDNYDKNKLETITLDLPLEFRWRNSTPQSHRFFRIYSGAKLSYLVFNKSRFLSSSEKIVVKNNSDLNQLRTALYVAFGYNTWNFYASYGITPQFKSSAKIVNETIGLQPLHLGLMFYIL